MPAIVDIVHRFATENSPYTREVLNNAVIVVDPGRQPGRLAQGRRLLHPDGEHRLRAHVPGPVPPLRRATTTTATGSCSRRPRPSTGSTSTQRFNPVVEHFMHQQGATGSPHLRAAVGRAGLAEPRPDRARVRQRARPGDRQVPDRRRLQGRPALDGHPELLRDHVLSADVATYGSWRGSSLLLTETADPARPRLPVLQRQPARPAGPLDGRPGPVPRHDLDARAGQRVRQGRALLRRALDRPQRPGLAVELALPARRRRRSNWQDAPYAYVLPAGQRDPYAVYECCTRSSWARSRSSAPRRRSPPAARATPRAPTCCSTQQPDRPLRQPAPRRRDVPDMGPPVRDVPADDALQRVHRQHPAASSASPRTRSRPRSRPRPSAVAQVAPEIGAAAGRRRRRPAPTSSRPAPTASPSCSATLQKWDVPTFRAGAAFSAGGREYAAGHGDRAADGAGADGARRESRRRPAWPSTRSTRRRTSPASSSSPARASA